VLAVARATPGILVISTRDEALAAAHRDVTAASFRVAGRRIESELPQKRAFVRTTKLSSEAEKSLASAAGKLPARVALESPAELAQLLPSRAQLPNRIALAAVPRSLRERAEKGKRCVCAQTTRAGTRGHFAATSRSNSTTVEFPRSNGRALFRDTRTFLSALEHLPRVLLRRRSALPSSHAGAIRFASLFVACASTFADIKSEDTSRRHRRIDPLSRSTVAIARGNIEQRSIWCLAGFPSPMSLVSLARVGKFIRFIVAALIT